MSGAGGEDHDFMPLPPIPTDTYEGKVNKKACVDCMGCINNCPVQAIRIVYWGKPLVGYFEFLTKNHLTILEPKAVGQGELSSVI